MFLGQNGLYNICNTRCSKQKAICIEDFGKFYPSLGLFSSQERKGKFAQQSSIRKNTKGFNTANKKYYNTTCNRCIMSVCFWEETARVSGKSSPWFSDFMSMTTLNRSEEGSRITFILGHQEFLVEPPPSYSAWFINTFFVWEWVSHRT